MHQPNPHGPEPTEITPSQFFDTKNNVALIAIPPSKTSSDKYGHIVTSDRRKIPLSAGSLLETGYVTDRHPHLKQRWSTASIEGFLRGEGSEKLVDAFTKILQELEQYIDIGAYENVETLALWIVGTYMYRMFSAFPYIHLNGMPGSGKSKTLHLISLLAFNACMSTDPTAPALVRMTHDNQAVLCLDEVERLKKAVDESSKAIMAALNTGYKKGFPIIKLESPSNQKGWDPKEYDPYSPKVLACIRSLEEALSTRCISLTLIRSENVDIVNREIDIDSNIWQEIRDAIYVGVMHEWTDIRDISLAVTETELRGRDWENWKPILVLAKHFASVFPNLHERLRAFAIERSQEIHEIAMEENYRPKILTGLFHYIRKVTRQNDCFVSLHELLDYLCMHDPETFRDSSQQRSWLSTRRLADDLRKLGVVNGPAKQQKIQGENRKGFTINYSQLKRRMAIHGLNPQEDEM
jgi:hypothetical protein